MPLFRGIFRTLVQRMTPRRATVVTADISGVFDSLPSQPLLRHLQTHLTFLRKRPSACRTLQSRIDIKILTHRQTVQLILSLIKMHLIGPCHVNAVLVTFLLVFHLLNSQEDIQLQETGTHPYSAHHIVIQLSKLDTMSTS